MSKFKLKHQRNSAILNNGEEKVLKKFPKVPIPTLKPMMPNTLQFPKVPIPIGQPDQFGNVDPLAQNIAMVTLKHDRQNAAKEAERLRQLQSDQLKKDALNAMQNSFNKKIDWDATQASWLNSMNEDNEEVVDQSFKNQLDEVIDNSDNAVLMMKKNSSTPFKMKHQSPLNDGVVSSSGSEDTIDYSNMTDAQKASLADFWESEIEAYGGIEPGSEGYAELVGANRYAVYDRGRFNPRNQTYQFDKPQWRLKGGGPEYDNPEGIHPDQLMRMYQGDDNVYE